MNVQGATVERALGRSIMSRFQCPDLLFDEVGGS